MDIAVLGTGMVGQTLSTRLLSLGHRVTMGSRTRDSEPAVGWLAGVSSSMTSRAAIGTFADATAAGEMIINATNGVASLEALASADPATLADKLLLDVANPLDFSRGFPPRLSVCNDDSLGEQIQREYPDTRVVKSLNTMNCQVMADPSRVPGEHVVFVCGNDDEAKDRVRELLAEFGWQPGWIMDLGDLSAARNTEMYLPLWVRLMGVLGTADFNINVVH